jgi:hypothetical protein
MINENIEFLLKDNRNCASKNLKEFFRKEIKDKPNSAHMWQVIRWKGELWFATLGWRVTEGKDDGFAGVSVKSVACFGKKAFQGYPSSQTGGDYDDVTEWFWDKYRERGMISIPEIWHITLPKQLKHSESHTI